MRRLALVLLCSSVVGCGGLISDSGNANGDPGTKVAHRLNHAEYNNTLRDLLGTTQRPADTFPGDAQSDGFDNIADALTLPPALLEMHELAVTTLIEEAFGASPTQGGNTSTKGRVLICNLEQEDTACIERIIANFTKRAWRRPATKEELSRLNALVQAAQDEGESSYEGLKLAFTAALISANFLYRIEVDPKNSVHKLNDYELASRLSYFIWSSMPDDELFAAADAETLQNTNVLVAQVQRMLADSKAAALTDNFAGQWLRTRHLTKHQPDATIFGSFDASLTNAMQEETSLLFADVVSDESSIKDLLLANATYANQALAEFYGIDFPNDAAPDSFQKINTAGTNRSGVLGHAGLLMTLSLPTRTSPVKRGKWILGQLLCSEPPPPPPGAENLMLPEGFSGSLRDLLKEHRKNPACTGCHQVMDELGFGLENFDGIGKYRTMDGTFIIDSNGTLPDGRTFSGGVELAMTVANDSLYPHCVTDRLLTYALGRKLQTGDSKEVERLSQALVASDFSFGELVKLIVTSDAFRKRRPPEQSQ